MIKPDFFELQQELHKAADQPDCHYALDQWFKKWVQEIHGVYSYNRDMLRHYNQDEAKIIAYTDQKMHYEMGREILKKGFSIIDRDSAPQFEENNPDTREDRYTIYILGVAPRQVPK